MDDAISDRNAVNTILRYRACLPTSNHFSKLTLCLTRDSLHVTRPLSQVHTMVNSRGILRSLTTKQI